MENLMKEFREDIKDFREMTDKFYGKEVSMKEYKGFSGGFGSYAQRGGNVSMIRFRLPGGRISKDKLKFLADTVEKYQINKAHLTTCQTVQFHNVEGKFVGDIMEEALDAGIITRGGGGDFPRNVMVSPLSGVEKGEYFDVLPFAQKVSDYLITQIKAVHMPRKLKVGFSNSPANVTHATFRDLGFVARENGNFDVYSAGGLGNNARFGVKVGEDVAPSELLYYVKAMIETFITYGNYENRGKARTRYMQETLGEEGYKEAFQKKLDEVKGKYDLSMTVEEISHMKEGNGSTVFDSRVIEQKQEGLYTVVYHPIGGIIPVDKFGELYGVIRDMEEAELRIAPDETLYIINLNGEEAKKVLSVTSDGAKTLFETSVACIGSTICQVGLRDSQGLLAAIIQEVDAHNFADGVLPRIHISGCPSSCGTHQIGQLGFRGASKKVDGKMQPAFAFFVNGYDGQGEERFGEEWGIMTAEDIPHFFVDLGEEISRQDMTYDEWFEKKPEDLRKIAEKYL